MIHLSGRIRDYAPSTDTCSVELDGHGIIESWFDNVKIDPAINRGFIIHGASATLSVPDEHRLNEAVLIGVGDSPGAAAISSGAATQSVQTGRGYLGTDGTGSSTATVSFSPAFSLAPRVTCTVDNHIKPVISGVTTKGFYLSFGGGPANGNVAFSWQAEGNA